MIFALFAWLISRNFSANEQYFSFITNQLTVLSVMAYQLKSKKQGTPWSTAWATGLCGIRPYLNFLCLSYHRLTLSVNLLHMNTETRRCSLIYVCTEPFFSNQSQ